MNNDELQHFGIPGMKWGRRKNKYITARQGHNKASAAGKKAARESLANDKKTLSGIGSARKALNNASKARRQAYRESIKESKAYNKQLKENSSNEKWSTKKKVAVGTAVVAGVLATYGAVKMKQAKINVTDKNSGRKYVVNTLTKTIRSKDVPSLKFKVDKNTINMIQANILDNMK